MVRGIRLVVVVNSCKRSSENLSEMGYHYSSTAIGAKIQQPFVQKVNILEKMSVKVGSCVEMRKCC